MKLISPRKAKPGDKVAVVSPSFAAPAVAPAIHEQALQRLEAVTGLIPVEFPTTRKRGASARERAGDLNSAFADPDIRAVVATIGGEDQITVIPHLDGSLAANDQKPFLGYSDNTNLLNWLWTNGVASYYGGSTQVQLGPGPGVDPIHERSLRAARLTGERIELVEPGESEDHGMPWTPSSSPGHRHPTSRSGPLPSSARTSAPSSATQPSTSSGTTTPRRLSWWDRRLAIPDQQWIVPYGGFMTVDGTRRRIFADNS